MLIVSFHISYTVVSFSTIHYSYLLWRVYHERSFPSLLWDYVISGPHDVCVVRRSLEKGASPSKAANLCLLKCWSLETDTYRTGCLFWSFKCRHLQGLWHVFVHKTSWTNAEKNHILSANPRSHIILSTVKAHLRRLVSVAARVSYLVSVETTSDSTLSRMLSRKY